MDKQGALGQESQLAGKTAGKDKKSALLLLAIVCCLVLMIYRPDLFSPEMLPGLGSSTPTGGEATPTETTDASLPKTETSLDSAIAGTADLDEVRTSNSNEVSAENLADVTPSAQSKAKEPEEPVSAFDDDDPWGEEVTMKPAAAPTRGVVVSDEVRQVGGSDMEPGEQSRSSEPR